MSIIATYADDPALPSSSAVRHLVTDASVSSITDSQGNAVTFALQSQTDTQYTYVFSTSLAGGTLPDGNYFADGQEFYSLFGDFNGDRAVDNADADTFRGVYNTVRGRDAAYRSDADWNDDGAINNADAREFARNYGKTLPA